LHQLTHQSGIPVGVPVAYRSDEQYHDVIGYFVNLLVVPTHVRPGQTFASLVRDLNGTVLDVLDRADAPFDLVVARLNPPRRAGRTPLVRVAFAYEYVPSEFESPPGLRVLTPYRDAFPSVGASRFDMLLTLLDDGVTISAHLEYDRALYDDATASHVFSRYQRFLAAALDTPTLRVDAEPEGPDSSNAPDHDPSKIPDFRFDLEDER
jgi:non-ribosomal peptide synthetase component F